MYDHNLAVAGGFDQFLRRDQNLTVWPGYERISTGSTSPGIAPQPKESAWLGLLNGVTQAAVSRLGVRDDASPAPQPPFIPASYQQEGSAGLLRDPVVLVIGALVLGIGIYAVSK